MTTKSQQTATDVAALLRARTPLLWVNTQEEARVEKYLVEAAASAGYEVICWDVSAGTRDVTGKVINADMKSPEDLLGYIQALADGTTSGRRIAWVLRDLHVWVGSGPNFATVQRALKNLARSLPQVVREKAQAVIVLSSSTEIPQELAGHTTVINWDVPDRMEIGSILDAAIESLPEKLRVTALPEGTRDTAIDAAIGLSGEEASSCYAKSLVQFKCIDPVVVATEKKRIIAREKVLEWVEPVQGGLEAIGGLDILKSWLIQRKCAFSPAARAYGLLPPKGVLLAGVPGCGKSLTAKAIATAWGIPLLRLDLGALRSKYVGSSEENIRKAFRVIEAIGKCVVWVDEIEKALSGATSGAADGGVAADALGTLLSWMQDHTGESFVVATANAVESLPPELLRRGRFDEIFYVDLPTAQERLGILKASLRANGQNDALPGLSAVVVACEGFAGAEIAALTQEALFTSFADGARPLTSQDLIEAAKTVVPLGRLAAEKIEKLRAWAKGRARMASSEEITPVAGPALRVIEV
jgi:hypothetical protein